MGPKPSQPQTAELFRPHLDELLSMQHPLVAYSHPIGQGFSVRGEASKRRVGSNQKVTNILTPIVMQRESAITRGEKNSVAKMLYLMAMQNPAPAWYRWTARRESAR